MMTLNDFVWVIKLKVASLLIVANKQISAMKMSYSEYCLPKKQA